MSQPAVAVDPQVQIFSATKYKIMQLLKKEGGTDLESLSRQLAVSQMAVYKHLRELEKDGLVEHEARKNGVGRPRMHFRTTSRASGIYPTFYSQVSLMILEYVRDRLGSEGVEDVFNKMLERWIGKYTEKVGGGSLAQRVRKLADARLGFYAEPVVKGDGSLELLQRSCPVSRIASKYRVVCEEERKLFERVLDADVKLLSADPQGVEPCRFRIRPRG
jgi:predicted ArsR family transcriptional regulator